MRMTSIIMGLLALGAFVSSMPGKAQAYDDYCREYTRTVFIGHRQEVAYGTACYQPNGDWKIVDETDEDRIGQRFRNEDISKRYVPVYEPVYQLRSRTYYYQPVPQRSQIIFVTDNDRHGPPYKYGHYKHDRYDRRYDHHDDHYYYVYR